MLNVQLATDTNVLFDTENNGFIGNVGNPSPPSEGPMQANDAANGRLSGSMATGTGKERRECGANPTIHSAENG